MMTYPTKETLDRLDAILTAPSRKRIGVLGLGVVGRAIALHLLRRGAMVVAADLDQRLGLAAEDFVRDLSDGGAELRLGPMDRSTLADVDALAISPGVNPDQAVVQGALARGIPVFGELDLCSALPAAVAAVAAITGTNGKSTTTTLLGALVAASGKSVFVGGNLGDPIIAWLDRGEPTDVAVLELSSFQLETAYRFAPNVAVILNVTPDHADRYDDIHAYARTKRRLVEKMAAAGIAVLSHDDAYVRAMAPASSGDVWWFSTRDDAVPGSGAVLRDDRLIPFGDAAGLGEIELDHPRLFGRHNRENTIAAFLAWYALGCDMIDDAVAAYRGFAGLAHRLEWVAEIDGIQWINDSKATNDESAATAVRAMGSIGHGLVLLLGGRDKGGGYERVLSAALHGVSGRTRTVIVFGEARAVIARAFAAHPHVVSCDRMEEALELARGYAVSGDAVLLAPACSSFDEFTDYRARGDAFKAWVSVLASEGRS